MMRSRLAWTFSISAASPEYKSSSIRLALDSSSATMVPPVSLIIVVSTTLAWALILAPLHVAAQAFIERHFNRRMQENARAIEAFSAVLREEIDLDKVRDGLLKVVQQTMQPQTSAIWVRKAGQLEGQEPPAESLYQLSPGEITVADTDPLLDYALTHPGTLEVKRLRLDSPMMQVLRTNVVDVLLPLASQGELIGLLTLGPRMDGERYGHQNSALLTTLAASVAPTLRVTQLVQEQQEQVRGTGTARAGITDRPAHSAHLFAQRAPHPGRMGD